MRNLADLWANCAAAGSRNLVVAYVIETGAALTDIVAAVPGAQPFMVHLRAGAETLLARVRRREIGAVRDWHEARALELAEILEHGPEADLVIDADTLTPDEVAERIITLVDWAK